MNYSLERPNEQKKNSKTKLTERDQSATTGDSNNNAKKKKNHPFRVEEDACRFDLEDSFLLFFSSHGQQHWQQGGGGGGGGGCSRLDPGWPAQRQAVLPLSLYLQHSKGSLMAHALNKSQES